MEFNYIYEKQADQFSNVNIPKFLIKEERFSGLSLESKLLYGLILDRMGISQKNNWKDEEGHIYVLYPVSEIQEDMNRSEASVNQYISELEKAGLLEKKMRGSGLPCMLYLKKISYQREV